jgi:hypothetical protein
MLRNIDDPYLGRRERSEAVAGSILARERDRDHALGHRRVGGIRRVLGHRGIVVVDFKKYGVTVRVECAANNALKF